MNPSLYLETTIPSFLTGRPSRDHLIAGQQAATKMAAKRLQLLKPVQMLPVPFEADELARQILEKHLLPPKAAVDAFHIATATVHGMHFLLTWNCIHINNREIIPGVERLCSRAGYPLPVICTPLELMGTSDL
jgi:hypothetical protein